MNIEQIAYEEASGEMLDCFSKEQLAGYLLRCLSKLAALDVEPVAWWVPKAEQFAIMDKPKTRPFAKAFEPLFTKAQLLASQQRTAEACAKVCSSRRRTVSNGNGLSMWSHDPASVEAGYCADAISNGDWRKYL